MESLLFFAYYSEIVRGVVGNVGIVGVVNVVGFIRLTTQH